MTSPNDPNAPQGWGEPPSNPPETPPDQPGWGAPPPPNQPGWGAPPPPNQPGWGAPPPPNQPGWGAPPLPLPGAQPGWGAPQGYPGWGQPGWAPQPQRKSRGCLIAALVVVGLLVVLVGGCAWLVGPIVGTELKVTNDLGPRATNVSLNWVNGEWSFQVHLAAGHENEAVSIACQIVGPDIKTSSTPNAHFEIVSSGGYILADETTPCG